MKKQKLILISFFFLLFNINHLLSSEQNYLLISGKPKIKDVDTIKINNKKIFYYLILISIFLELMHLLIPIRAFQIQDLLGNIFGVVISYFIFKILNT